MSNRSILIAVLVVVIAIGAFMIHEANESPLEKAGESIEQMFDNTKDAVEDAAEEIN